MRKKIKKIFCPRLPGMSATGRPSKDGSAEEEIRRGELLGRGLGVFVKKFGSRPTDLPGRRIGFLFLLVILSGFVARAAELSLVYENKEAAQAGKFVLGTVTPAGVLVSASGLKLSGDILMGTVEGDLRTSSLVRMDNELNVYLLKTGDAVTDAKLQELHRQRSASVVEFLPRNAVLSITSMTMLAAPLQAATPSGPAYEVKINGQRVGDEAVKIPRHKKSAKMKLEIIRGNGEALWQMKANLSSEPEMYFWNTEKQRGLNAIPAKTLTYNFQALVRPMTKGHVIKIPVDLSSIKEDSYVWTLTMKAKTESVEVKIPVQFVEN